MSNGRLRAVGYRRVSMKEQVDGFSLDAQENNIKQYIQNQGWEFIQLYTDAGVSAKKDSHRPALEEMLQDAAHHYFNVIVVDKVDRFYRHLRGLLVALDQLNNLDVSFVSVQERLDFTSPWGKLTLTVLGTLAEIYIDNLRQETHKGKLQRARDGLWNGNIPYGYCRGLCSKCKEPNGENYCPDFGKTDQGNGRFLMCHPVESKVVRIVYDWYLTGGESDGHIANKLREYPVTTTGLFARTRGIPGHRSVGTIKKDTIRNILTNAFYAGVIPYYGAVEPGQPSTRRAKELFPGKHSAIVSMKEFERIQEIRQALYKTPRFNHPRQARIYLLSGILRCAHCGLNMRGSSNANASDLRYYRDATQLDRSGECPQEMVRAERVEQQLLEWLRRIFEQAALDEKIELYEDVYRKARERFERVKELYLAGELDQAYYLQEKEKFESAKMPLPEIGLDAIITLKEKMRTQLSAWQNLPPIEKKRLFQIAAETVFIQGSVLVGVQPTLALLPFIPYVPEHKDV